MATEKIIKGRKGGGGSPRTPVEQPDDLQSVAKAKILLALGEGEFAGELTAKNIYLDGTALENADGSENFSGVTWEFRPGTQSQKYIQGIPSTENEINVGSIVSSATAWTRTFTNPQLSAIRLRLKWPSLFKQQDNGDLVGNSVKYAIDLQTDGGAWKTVLNTAVTGKTTSGYERSHRIDLPQEGNAWTLRLRKITIDANSAKIGDAMTLQSFTEVIDAKLRYPHTALLHIEFDSSQFNGSIPQISCEPRGRVIRVPNNYDPETREYSGVWQGEFEWAWTDNPAWIFYDIVISDRFGLGNRLTAANIDKWSLYQIAQYCDQPVPDGKGGSGTEPRYICNVYIQDRNDAYTVIRDFAAIFRGMTYWGGDQIVALADMPRDVDYSYTRANVINGLFNYSSSTTKARYTQALVSWSDPDNGYADAMEPAFEQALVARFGFNQLELTAIGCTRQSEANRKGRWGILTNNKDRMVSFDVGVDGNIPQPGYIIAVADEMLSGKVMGGRVSKVNGRVITLDRIADIKSGDRLTLNLPSGKSEGRTVQAVNGKGITVGTAYGEAPEVEAIWVVESDELYAQQYRVISVSDNNDGSFSITGALHDPDKYARIDTGAVIEQRPISVIPPSNQLAPSEIAISSFSVVRQGINVETMRVSWEQAQNAISYEAQWRRDDSNWVNVPRSSTTSFDVTGIYAGRYLVRVRAINAAEISSGWGYSEEKLLTGKTGNPPKPIALTTSSLVFGVTLNWGFPSGSGDTQKTEIQYSATGKDSDAILLADVAYPQSKYQQMGLKAGQVFWYRAQLVDRLGNESGYTDWLRGQASSDADDILDYLAGQINETHLGKELLGNLDAINDNLDALGKSTLEAGLQIADNRKQLDEKTAKLSARVDDVEADLSDAEERLSNEVGSLESKTQQNAVDITDTRQTLSETAQRLQDSVDAVDAAVGKNTADIDGARKNLTELAGDIDVNTSEIKKETEARKEGDKILGQSIEAIQTKSELADAKIITLEQAQVSLESAQASTTQSLEATARAQLESGLKQEGDNQALRQASAKLTTQQIVLADEQGAQARLLTQFDAKFEGATAQLQEETKTLASEGKALAERVGAVDAKVDDNAATARDQTQAVATDLAAETKRVSDLSTKSANNEAAIQAEQKARTERDKALAESINVVKAATEKTDAKVVTLEQAQSSLESAQASTSQSLEASFAASVSADDALARAQLEQGLKQAGDDKAQRQAGAKLTSQQTVLADTQQAQARELVQFDAKYGEATARLQEETETLAKADEAMAQRFTSLDSKVDQNAATARDQTKTVATDLAAESKRVNDLSAKTENLTADIQAETTARTDGDKALAESIGVVKTASDKADAKIVNLEKSQSSLESAQASTAQSLEASFLSDDALARAQLEQGLKQAGDDKTQREISAKITASQKVTADGLKAQGERISSIDTKYGDATAQLARQDLALSEQNKATVEQLQTLTATVGDNAAKATQETKTVSDALSAEVKRVDDLTSSVGENTAGIQSEAKTRAEADSAISQTVTGLEARTESAESNITEIQRTQSDMQGSSASTQSSLEATARAALENGLRDVEGQREQAAATARIDTKQEVQATELTALARDMTIVRAEVGDAKASAQQSMDAVVGLNGKISASYSMRVEVDNKGNKIVAGIGLGVDGEGNSDFIVNANRFSVMMPGETPQLAFAVINGQTVIRDGLIANASIGRAKITDVLSSDNYEKDKSGAYINFKTGRAEFFGAKVRGEIIADSGEFNNVTINNSLIIRNLRKASGTINEFKLYHELGFSKYTELTIAIDTGVTANSWINPDQRIMAGSAGLQKGDVSVTATGGTATADWAISVDSVFIRSRWSGGGTYHMQLTLRIWINGSGRDFKVDMRNATPIWKLQEIT